MEIELLGGPADGSRIDITRPGVGTVIIPDLRFGITHLRYRRQTDSLYVYEGVERRLIKK